jgi:hypothetical protein
MDRRPPAIPTSPLYVTSLLPFFSKSFYRAEWRLLIKISRTGYFFDPSLELPYNSVGYDAATLLPSPDPGPLPDAELVPVLYLAVAARVSLIGIGADVMGNGDIFTGEHVYGELGMRCKLTTFDVIYSRVGGKLLNVLSSESTNGTALEIFHGVQFYDVTSDSQLDTLEMLSQASLEPTTAALRKTWEDLMSFKILSVIGSVMIPQSALQQQTRIRRLVAKIPWSSLALVCGVTLMQVALGCQIVLLIYVKNRVDFRDGLTGEQLSTPGACWGAFCPPAISLASLRLRPPTAGLRAEDVESGKYQRVGVVDDDGPCSRLILEELRAESARC